LSGLAGGKGEFEERLVAGWPDPADIVFDDGEAPLKACLAQALEDLLRAVRVRLQAANDAGLERIKPAAPPHRLAGVVLRASQPLGHRVRMQAQARAVWAMVSFCRSWQSLIL